MFPSPPPKSTSASFKLIFKSCVVQMSQAVKRHVTMFCLDRSPAAQADLKFTCRASGGLELLILLIHISNSAIPGPTWLCNNMESCAFVLCSD